jgi:hypothetical protein
LQYIFPICNDIDRLLYDFSSNIPHHVLLSAIPISWGHPDPLIRGPVICTVRHSSQRNAIGAHSGSYCIYTGLAVAAGKLNPEYVPNLKLTSPVFTIGPHPGWSDPKKVASIDPFGHVSYVMHVCIICVLFICILIIIYNNSHHHINYLTSII